MIHNKSTHPVEVKKISIRIWGLRDEIEAALGRRMKECEAAGVPLYIEDIKKFYHLTNQIQTNDNVVPLKKVQNENEDGISSLMEEIGEDQKNDNKEEKLQEEKLQEEKLTDENKNLQKAEEIIAEQTSQGLENKTPNPILNRPYQRQAPDLDKISYGFCFLSDINMEFMLNFTKDKFLKGQSVTIDFLIPNNFMLTADVTYCHNFAMRSRIISSSRPDYRVQCHFNFSIPGERNNLRNFLKSIEPSIATEKKKVQKDAPNEEEVGDEKNGQGSEQDSAAEV
jgi:hypothetical protein